MSREHAHSPTHDHHDHHDAVYDVHKAFINPFRAEFDPTTPLPLT